MQGAINGANEQDIQNLAWARLSSATAKAIPQVAKLDMAVQRSIICLKTAPRQMHVQYIQ
jgi:hypothetical protein